MKMFRENALLKLRSPEQTDEPLKIAPRWTKVAAYTGLVLVVFAVAWSALATLPQVGRGQAVLLSLNSVVPVQARATGRIALWRVGVGEQVEAGAILGVLQQPEIERELAATQARLVELRSRNKTLRTLRERFTGLERSAIDRQRVVVQGRLSQLSELIGRMRQLTETLHQEGLQEVEQQRGNLLVSTEAQQKLTERLRQRYQNFAALAARNNARKDAVVRSRRQYEDSELKLSELNLELQNLDLKKLELDQAALEGRNRVAARDARLTQLDLDLRELDNQSAELAKQENQQRLREIGEIEALQRSVERLTAQLARERNIVAEDAGRVLELTAVEGSNVNIGDRLLQLDIRDSDDEIVALAYFRDNVGKRLKSGMEVRISPANIPAQRFGSLLGHIESVGGFPVTEASAVTSIGNSAVAAKLLADRHEIQVIARLKPAPDTPSGFAWTSQPGPSVEISAGMLAQVAVTHERRTPVSYVGPLMRKWLGL